MRLTLAAAAAALHCQSVSLASARATVQRQVLHPMAVTLGLVLSLPPEPSPEELFAALEPDPLRFGVRLQPPARPAGWRVPR